MVRLCQNLLVKRKKKGRYVAGLIKSLGSYIYEGRTYLFPKILCSSSFSAETPWG